MKRKEQRRQWTKSHFRRPLSLLVALAMCLSLLPTMAFAEGSVTEVSTLAELTSAVASGGEVKLVENITLTKYLEITKDTSLDLNGKTLNTGYVYLKLSGGTLTVKDSTSTGETNGTGVISGSSSSGIVYMNKGSLTLESGSLISTSKAIGGPYSDVSGVIKIAGGVVQGGGWSHTIDTSYSPSLSIEITGGTLTKSSSTYIINTKGNVAISGGTFVGGGDAVRSNGSGAITITGGNFGSSNIYGNSSVVTITGLTMGTGKITGKLIVNSGDFTKGDISPSSGSIIHGGTFRASSIANLKNYLVSGSNLYADSSTAIVANAQPSGFMTVADLNGRVFYSDVSGLSAANGDVITFYENSSKGLSVSSEVNSSITVVTKPTVTYSGTVTMNNAFLFPNRGIQTTTTVLTDGSVSTTYTTAVVRFDAKRYSEYYPSKTGDGVGYENVSEAIKASTSVNDLVVLTKDNPAIKEAQVSSSYSYAKSATFDLNGKTIGSDTDAATTVFANLPNSGYEENFIDRVGGASVTTGGNYYLFYGNGFGKLNIYGGTYTNKPSSTSTDAVFNLGQGTVNVYGGTYVGNNRIFGGSASMVVDYDAGAKWGNHDTGFPVFSGAFTMTAGTLTLKKGYFDTTFNVTGGTFKVEGGYFSETSKASLDAVGTFEDAIEWDVNDDGSLKTFVKNGMTYYHVYDPTYIDNAYDTIEAVTETTYKTADKNYVLKGAGDWIVVDNAANEGKVITDVDGYAVASVALNTIGDRTVSYGSGTLYAAVPKGSKVMVVNKGHKYVGAYGLLTDAMSAVTDAQDTLVLLSDFGATWFYSHATGAPTPKSLILDLNGHKWNGEAGTMDGLLHNHTKDVNMTLIDSTGKAKVTTTDSAAICEYNYGAITIYSGEYAADSNAQYVLSTIGPDFVKDYTALLNIYGGAFTSDNGDSGVAQFFRSTVNIYDGAFTANNGGAVMRFGANNIVNIYGGKFTGKVAGLTDNIDLDSNTINIHGGYFSQAAYEDLKDSARVTLASGEGWVQVGAAKKEELGLEGVYWTLGNPVTVTFKANGGSDVPDRTINKGDHADRPDDPTKTGYIFDGWYSDSELATEFDFANTSINADTTVYAKWTRLESEADGQATFHKDDVTETSILGIANSSPSGSINDQLKGIAEADIPEASENVVTDVSVTLDATAIQRDKSDNAQNAIVSATDTSGLEVESVTYNFLDLLIAKTVTEYTFEEDGNVAETKQLKSVITETEKIIDVPVKYDMTNKYNPMVIRYHDNEAQKFTRLYTPPSSLQDRTFYVEGSGSDAVIHIYSNQFSLYALVFHGASENPSVTAPTPKAALTYNGALQELVDAGATTGGTLMYALGNDAITAPSEGWSEAIPAATNAGTYYVWYKVVGDENYSGSEAKVVTSTIGNASAPPSTAKVSIANAVVELVEGSFVYDGTAKEPAVKSVTLGGKVLVAGADYAVSYSDNVEAGTAIAIVTGKGNYVGFATAAFTIKDALATRVSIVGAKVKLVKKSYSYDGKAKKPAVKSVTLDGKVLAAGVDYAVSYKNNKKVGTATVTVTGKGSYKGSVAVKFEIKLGRAKLSTTVHAKARVLSANWRKVPGATRYQLQWRERGGKWKSATVKKTTAVVGGLEAGGVYDLRVRAVSGSAKGAWSVQRHRWLVRQVGVVAASKKAGSVKVSWSEVEGADAGYKVVVRYSKKGKAVASEAVEANKTSITVRGLAPGEKAWVQVRALHSVGDKIYTGALKSAKSAVIVTGEAAKAQSSQPLADGDSIMVASL